MMSEFVDQNIVNNILPHDEKAKDETPWYEKARLKDAPHQYRKLRLLFSFSIELV